MEYLACICSSKNEKCVNKAITAFSFMALVKPKSNTQLKASTFTTKMAKCYKELKRLLRSGLGNIPLTFFCGGNSRFSIWRCKK